MSTVTIKGIELDADPLALPVYDEVITRDCYRVDTIPRDIEHIIDVGAFHGEFMLWAHKHRPLASLLGYEPNIDSNSACYGNLLRGISDRRMWDLVWAAVGAFDGACNIEQPEGHPAGTSVQPDNDGTVRFYGIAGLVAGKKNVAIKLDCEGSERAIFSHLRWLQPVRWLAMEFHNHDGDYFADLLAKSGFVIGRLEGCQGDPWDPSMAGGIIIAWRPS